MTMRSIAPLLLCLALLPGCHRRGENVRKDEPPVTPNSCKLPEDGVIKTDWELSAPCQLSVTGDVVVSSGGTLRIGPGVTLSFGAGKALRVSGGALLARGDREHPVVLTASAADAHFGGVRFAPAPPATASASGSASSSASAAGVDPKLARAAALRDAREFGMIGLLSGGGASSRPRRYVGYIADGGERPSELPRPSNLAFVRVVRAGDDHTAALHIEQGAGEVSLSDVSIIDATRVGLESAAAYALARGDRVSIRGAGVPSIDLPAEAFGHLTELELDASPHVYGRIRHTASWPALKVPITASTLVVAGESAPILSLAPGTTLAFARGSGLFIGESKLAGALIAERATFTSDAKVPRWRGLTFAGSAPARGTRIKASTFSHIDGAAIELPDDESGIELSDLGFDDVGTAAIASWKGCPKWRPSVAKVSTGTTACEFIEPPPPLFGGGSPLGNDVSGLGLGELGNLYGDKPGDSFGHGGLAMSGTGAGGGGRGDAVGLGSIGGLGRASRPAGSASSK